MVDPITVVLVRPGEAPTVVVVDNELDDLQGLVGGYLEIVNVDPRQLRTPIHPHGPRYVVVCNEDGLSLRLPYNRGLLGPWFVCFFSIRGHFMGLDARHVVDVLAAIEPSADAAGRRVALGLLGLGPLAGVGDRHDA